MLSTFFDRDPAALTDELILSDMGNRLGENESRSRRRTLDRFLGSLEYPTEFEQSPKWEKVIQYRAIDAQATHDAIVYREIVNGRFRRVLPIIGVFVGGIDTTAWFTAETGAYDIDCETAHMAGSLAVRIMGMSESSIVEVAYINEGYIR